MNVVGTPPGEGLGVQAAQFEAQAESASRWFFWIAGLSLVNTVMFMAGVDWSFVIGLFTTQYIEIMSKFGLLTVSQSTAVAGNFVIIVLMAIFGVFAGRHRTWAFAVGMVFYGLDTLFLVHFGLKYNAMGDIALNAIFHALAVFSIVGGLMACTKLAKVKEQMAKAAYHSQRAAQDPYQQPVDPTNPTLPR